MSCSGSNGATRAKARLWMSLPKGTTRWRDSREDRTPAILFISAARASFSDLSRQAFSGKGPPT